jgi:hypothetical protein
MKVGDLVKAANHVFDIDDDVPQVGLVLEFHSWDHPATNNVRVQWPRKVLWHHPSVLEIVSESR